MKPEKREQMKTEKTNMKTKRSRKESEKKRRNRKYQEKKLREFLNIFYFFVLLDI